MGATTGCELTYPAVTKRELGHQRWEDNFQRVKRGQNIQYVDKATRQKKKNTLSTLFSFENDEAFIVSRRRH